MQNTSNGPPGKLSSVLGDTVTKFSIAKVDIQIDEKIVVQLDGLARIS